jgi:hypothetical protein
LLQIESARRVPRRRRTLWGIDNNEIAQVCACAFRDDVTCILIAHRLADAIGAEPHADTQPGFGAARQHNAISRR